MFWGYVQFLREIWTRCPDKCPDYAKVGQHVQLNVQLA